MTHLFATPPGSTFTAAGNLVHPSPEDWERARQFVDGPFSEGNDPAWVARHRESAIRSAAVAEMQRREAREWREQSRQGDPHALPQQTEAAAAVSRLNHQRSEAA